jgi:hypothetical protein
MPLNPRRYRSTGNTVVVSLAVALALISFAGMASAQVGREDLDKILGALAEVITTRAKEVAADTLRDQVANDLCVGARTITVRTPRKTSKTLLALRFGGDAACAEDDTHCTADDVFVESCRLLKMDEIGVTDPHLLKTIGRETISFAIRVGAHQVSAERYDKLGFPALGRYVFELMAGLKGGHLDQSTVISTTLDFADQLGREADAHLAENALKAARVTPAVDEMLNRAHDTGKNACAAKDEGRKAACDYFSSFPAPPHTPFDSGSPVCAAFSRGDAVTARTRMFRALFDENSPYHAAVRDRCSLAFSDTQRTAACQVAQIGRLLDALFRTKCTDEPTAANFRQLVYVLFEERAQYEEAIGGDAELNAIAGALKPHLLGASTATLAAILRVVSTGIRARQSSANLTSSFLQDLRSDVGQVTASGYSSILNGKALAWTNRNRFKDDLQVQAFRDAVKNLLALPIFVSGVESVSLNERNSAARLVAKLIDGMGALSASSSSPEAAVRTATQFLSTLAAAVVELKSAVGAHSGGSAAVKIVSEDLEVTASALSTTSTFLGLVANRDWVAITLGTSFVIVEAGVEKSGQPELVRSMAFLRLMMSVYQAETKDDAKAIFESALVSKSSRRSRFNRFAIDVSALLGARIGRQVDRTASAAVGDKKWNDSGFVGGIYAPIGVQVTSGHSGLLVYPVDLGAYLVAKPDDTSSKAWEAVRPGAALLLRMSPRYPVDLALSADYRPHIGDQTPQWRFGVSLTLELALFLIR